MCQGLSHTLTRNTFKFPVTYNKWEERQLSTLKCTFVPMVRSVIPGSSLCIIIPCPALWFLSFPAVGFPSSLGMWNLEFPGSTTRMPREHYQNKDHVRAQLAVCTCTMCRCSFCAFDVEYKSVPFVPSVHYSQYRVHTTKGFYSNSKDTGWLFKKRLFFQVPGIELAPVSEYWGLFRALSSNPLLPSVPARDRACILEKFHFLHTPVGEIRCNS